MFVPQLYLFFSCYILCLLMDFDAIQFASDAILEEYGLKAAGQRFSQRWFCQTQIQERWQLEEAVPNQKK
jgi:hypothetical protein